MKTISQAKKILEDLGKLQSKGQCGSLPCPRCGQHFMSDNPLNNALSRYATVYICDVCGMDEALTEAYGGERLALNRWAMIEGFEKSAVNESDVNKESEGNK